MGLVVVASPLIGSLQFFGTEAQDWDKAWIRIDNSEPANIGATDYSVEMWVQPSATASDNPGAGSAWTNGSIFFDRGFLGSDDRDIGCSLLSGAPTFHCRPSGSAGGNADATTDIRDGLWHHLMMTYNATTGDMQIYVDGTREGTATTSGGDASFTSSANPDNGTIVFGGEKHSFTAPSTYSFVGRMSEVRLSNIVRSTAASVTVPTTPLGVDANTLAYYPFNDGSGTVLTDTLNTSPGEVIFDSPPTVPVWSSDSPYA